MNKVIIFILIIVFIGGAAFFFTQTSDTPEKKQANEPVAMQRLPEQNGNKTQPTSNYAGSVFAGSTTPYLEFTKADFDKAKSEGKIILLNFYANWCPICRAELPDVKAAFDGLENPNIVGFQVNYKDDTTDADEKDLAKEFGVTYQHTKVILKDGKQVLKETAQWSKGEFLEALK